MWWQKKKGQSDIVKLFLNGAGQMVINSGSMFLFRRERYTVILLLDSWLDGLGKNKIKLFISYCETNYKNIFFMRLNREEK